MWWDAALRSGEAYDQVTEKALREARAVVVLWSPRSVESRWVRAEATQAARQGTLVPVMIEACTRPIMFELTQTSELMHWTGDGKDKAWMAFLADVRRFVEKTGASGLTAASVSPAIQPPPSKLSIAVLPFANMSDDPQQEYFSDGISEDIITDLSKVSALFVVARNTAFTLKGKSLDVQQIARQLSVGHVLEGSVRKAGGRVRITAQLIDGATGGHIWAERYDRDLTDIFALQDEISQAIVDALKLKLLPEEKKAIERRGTTNLEAYNFYLMARQYFDVGNVGDIRREEAILRLCGRATDIDPGYARAWALISQAQWSMRFNRGRSGDDGLAAAERAISLDPSLADAHAVKSRILDNMGRQAEASAALDIALGLDRESDFVNQSAGQKCINEGRFEDAIAYYAKAVELTGTNYGSAGMLITCYNAIGDQEGARRAAKVALARAEAALAQDRGNGHAMAFGASALAVLGEVERAKDWISSALLIDPENTQMRYNFACALSRDLGDNDAALGMLEIVFEKISVGICAAARTDPDLDPLRGDARFQAMFATAEARLAAESAAAAKS